MYLGIDVSVHNGIINVKNIREAGYKRIIIRAGYGKNNIDQKFVNNAQACVNLSVPSGIYWFSYGYSEAMAANEGKYAVEAAKKYWIKCPIAFDLEYDSVSYARKNGVEISKNLATNMAIAFLKVVIENGFIPVLYTNNDYTKNYFDIPAIEQALGTKLYIWYARYANSISDNEKNLADIWQKSSKGSVDGINGSVDINEFYTDFSDTVQVGKKEKECNINILDFQKAANADGYRDADGKKLVEDGIDGPKTQYVRKQVILKALKTDDGYKVGSQGELVKLWQKRLCELGFDTDSDGKYGSDSRQKTLSLQEKLGLSKDGIAGYDSWSMSFYN